MEIDASRCLWALNHRRRPDLISLGCIHLPVPLNCAWGVLSDGPYNAADVVNLLKTSVRKGNTEEDVEWQSVMHWASTGQPLLQRQESPDQAADADTSESEVEEVPDPQTSKPKGEPINTSTRISRRPSASCGSKRRHGSGNEKTRRRRRRKTPQRMSEQITRGKKKRINWQRHPLRHTHRRKKGRPRASRLPCNVVSGLAYPSATARATASDRRPHVPLDHCCRWIIPEIQPVTQTVRLCWSCEALM